MTTDKELGRLIDDYKGNCVVEPLAEYRKIRRLLRKVRLACHTPGGRFGEDRCGRCPACKLMTMLLKD